MFNFLKDLDNDIRDVLLIQLRDLWTHTSTAIEGKLKIVDPDRFKQALLQGIGSAKAFGCGLMLVRRV